MAALRALGEASCGYCRKAGKNLARLQIGTAKLVLEIILRQAQQKIAIDSISLKSLRQVT